MLLDRDRRSAGHGWLDDLEQRQRTRVAVVGGAGRLGSWLTCFLSEAGHEVVIVDMRPPQPMAGIRYFKHDLSSSAAVPSGTFEGCHAVVHLAGLHGPHLVAGVSRRQFWPVNVGGTQAVLKAAVDAGVRRFILASSTSVFGSGTQVNRPARMLDERTPLSPENVYDLTKVAAERIVGAERGVDSTVLRFGRFFFPSQSGYHLRKLSTGLDVHDACQAIVRVLLREGMPSPAYCVASDLELSRKQREKLGFDVKGVLNEAVPGIVDAAISKGIDIPERVGKSVCSDRLRRDAGYDPEFTLQWVSEIWNAREASRDRRRFELRHLSRGWLGSAGTPESATPQFAPC